MKRKIKKKPIIILFISILLILSLIFGIIYLVKTANYHKTYDYKLEKLGYTKEEIVTLKTLDNTSIDYILTISYNKKIPRLITEKYFMEKNLKNYINYLNNNYSLTDVVAIINIGANNSWYTNIKESDLTKEQLLLINKFYYLDNSYDSSNMVKVSKQYSYGENQLLTEETYSAFIKMFKAAKKEDLTLIINSSYRSFEEQEKVYNNIKASKGEIEADKVAARAGHSEHQSGMSVDIQTYGSNASNFEEFEEFNWLLNNAHKYGFILRYPKNKEYLTGYSYEPWHYRYVGIETASYIYENDITFDEYYAYFIN